MKVGGIFYGEEGSEGEFVAKLAHSLHRNSAGEAEPLWDLSLPKRVLTKQLQVAI